MELRATQRPPDAQTPAAGSGMANKKHGCKVAVVSASMRARGELAAGVRRYDAGARMSSVKDSTFLLLPVSDAAVSSPPSPNPRLIRSRDTVVSGLCCPH